MEFKQASSILVSNFSLVFKLFLYILVITLIVSAITVGIISPILNLFMSEEKVANLISQTADDIKAYFNDEKSAHDTFNQLKGNFYEFFDYLLSREWYLIGIILTFVFSYLLYLFLFTLSSVPIADIINNSMASNLKYGFLSNFALNFRKSVKYSILKVLIFLPIDIVFIGALFGLTYGLFKLFASITILRFFTLTLILVLGIVIASLRQTLFSGWIPRLIFHPYEGTAYSLKKSFPAVKQNWKPLFMSYCCVYFCLYFLVVIGGLFTFGVMSIIAPSISYIILRIIELVSYYKTNKLKFYTDSMNVVNTVDYGMRDDEKTSDEQISNEQLILRNKKLNDRICEISYEPTRAEILENPNFYEALKLGLGGERISHNTLQIRFGISKTLAKAIIKTMEDMNFIVSKSKFGTKKVIITQEEYDRLLFGEIHKENL